MRINVNHIIWVTIHWHIIYKNHAEFDLFWINHSVKLWRSGRPSKVNKLSVQQSLSILKTSPGLFNWHTATTVLKKEDHLQNLPGRGAMFVEGGYDQPILALFYIFLYIFFTMCSKYDKTQRFWNFKTKARQHLPLSIFVIHKVRVLRCHHSKHKQLHPSPFVVRWPRSCPVFQHVAKLEVHLHKNPNLHRLLEVKETNLFASLENKDIKIMLRGSTTCVGMWHFL